MIVSQALSVGLIFDGIVALRLTDDVDGLLGMLGYLYNYALCVFCGVVVADLCLNFALLFILLTVSLFASK